MPPCRDVSDGSAEHRDTCFLRPWPAFPSLEGLAFQDRVERFDCGSPPVVAGAGDLHHPAQSLHLGGGAMVLNRLEATHQAVSPAGPAQDLPLALQFSRSGPQPLVLLIQHVAGGYRRRGRRPGACPARMRSARTRFRRVSRLTPGVGPHGGDVTDWVGALEDSRVVRAQCAGSDVARVGRSVRGV